MQLGEEGGELRLGPERRQIQALGVQLLELRDVPLQIQLADPVVGNRQRPGAGIGLQIQVGPADRDQDGAVGLDHAQGNAERFGVFDEFVAGNHHPSAIKEDRAAGTILSKRLRQRSSAAHRPSVRIVRIKREVRYREGRSGRSMRPVRRWFSVSRHPHLPSAHRGPVPRVRGASARCLGSTPISRPEC